MVPGRLLKQIEQFSLRRYTVVFAVAAGLCLLCAWLGTRLRLDTDILSMLPENNRIITVFRKSVRDFGSLDYFLVLIQAPEDGPVASGGASAEDYEEFADEFAARIGKLEGIEYVEHRFDENSPILTNLMENALLFLGPERLDEVRPLFEDRAIRSRIADLRENLASQPSFLVKLQATLDPLGLVTVLFESSLKNRGAFKIDLVDGYYLSTDRKSLLVIAKPRRPPQDVAFSHRLYEQVEQARRDAVRTVGRSLPPGDPNPLAAMTVKYGGGYMIAVDDSDLIKGDIWWNAIGSFLLVTALYLFCYRRLAAIAYSSIPLAVGQALTFGLAWLCLSSLNSATSGFTAMLMGLGTDFTIVMYGRYIEERRQGRSLEEAVGRIMGETALGVFTGAITSAGTFYALCVTEFPGLRHFGFLVGSGILLCMAAILFLLPAMIAYVEGRRVTRLAGLFAFAVFPPLPLPLIRWWEGRRPLEDVYRRLAGLSRRAWILLSIGVSLVVGGAICGWQRARRGQGVDGGEISLDVRAWLLGAGVGALVFIALLAVRLTMERRASRADAGARSPRKLYLHSFGVEKLLIVAGRWPVATVVLSLTVCLVLGAFALDIEFSENIKDMRSPNNRGVMVQEEIGRRYGGTHNTLMVLTHGASLEDALLKNREVAARLDLLAASGQIQGYESLLSYLPSPEAQRRVIADLAEGSPGALDLDRIERSFREALAENGFRPDAYDPYLGALRTLLRPPKVLTLPDLEAKQLGELVARYHREVGGEHITATYVFPGAAKLDRQRMDLMVRTIEEGDPQVEATGVALVGLEMRRLFRRDAVLAVLIGLILVSILLYIDFRRLSLTIFAMLQLLTGVIAMLGAMQLCGIAMNFVNAFATTMILGVGVDYGIHLLHRLARAEKPGDEGVLETGKAVVMAAVTNIAGFGTIAFSNYPGLKSVGLVCVLGTLGCLFTSLTLLPALMVLFPRARLGAQ